MDISAEIDEVLASHEGLSYVSADNVLIGDLYIDNVDYYQVKIDLDPYPNLFPIVYEIEDRIPKKAHRHIYTDTGSCCFTTSAKSQVLLKTKIKSLVQFIKDIVIPYFKNNSYYEINGNYFGEEHSHNGIIGVIEGYQDILKIKDVQRIALLIYEWLKGNKLGIRDSCYCGSRLSLKRCTEGSHKQAYKELRMIDKAILMKDLGKFKIMLESKDI